MTLRSLLMSQYLVFLRSNKHQRDFAHLFPAAGSFSQLGCKLAALFCWSSLGYKHSSSVYSSTSRPVLIRNLTISLRVPVLLWSNSGACGAVFFCVVWFCWESSAFSVFWLLLLHFGGNVFVRVWKVHSSASSVYLTHPGSILRLRAAELQIHLTAPKSPETHSRECV